MTSIILAVIVLGGLGVIFGCLLAYASDKFAVQVDPRQTQIRAILPGANCGGCGFPGCDGYAAACVAGTAAPNKCVACSSDTAAKIAEILGVAAESSEPKVAFVRCQGTPDKTSKDCIYLGTVDCQSASVVPGRGPESCTFGCMGFGTCVKACQFDAIHIENGVAKVDRDKCVGCSACVDACPRGVITLVPKAKKVTVACMNTMTGPFVRKSCTAGCIGCQICVKTCPKGAISMKGALAEIDHEKCVNCGLCATKCPAHAIVNVGKKPEVVKPQPQAS